VRVSFPEVQSLVEAGRTDVEIAWPMGGRTFFKVGGTSPSQKNVEKFCGLNWQL